jgi:acyl dehydratase
LKSLALTDTTIAAAMPVSKDALGKQWPPVTYQVGREKIREYANAIGATNPVHHDREAALAGGYSDVVAPPMFCVVYAAPAVGPAILDPEVGINFATMVHGGQEFVWGEPVCSGDEITTTATCADIYQKNDMGFYVFESQSVNEDGKQTVRGTWTNIVRGV